MKKLVLSFALALIAGVSFGQGANGVFFSEFGENFVLFFNGQQQNQDAASNVRIEDIKVDFAQIRVQFPDMPSEGFNTTVGFEIGQETTYIIKKNRKGAYVARLHSSVDINSAQPEPVVVAPRPSAPAPEARPEPVQRPQADEQTKTTVTTTTTTRQPGGERIGVNMQVPGGGVNISIDGMDMNMDMEVVEQTTITTTTTTASGTRPATEPVREEPVVRRPAVPGYNGPIGCDWPVENSSIDQMKRSISGQSFEDSKMKIAEQATRGKCMTTAQVKEIMGLFTFEDSKLEFAKFAYDFTYDVANYYIVNDVFTFSSSVDELNSHIEGR